MKKPAGAIPLDAVFWDSESISLRPQWFEWVTRMTLVGNFVDAALPLLFGGRRQAEPREAGPGARQEHPKQPVLARFDQGGSCPPRLRDSQLHSASTKRIRLHARNGCAPRPPSRRGLRNYHPCAVMTVVPCAQEA